MRGLFGVIRAVDESVGKVPFDYSKKMAWEENTLVVLYSDQGFYLEGAWLWFGTAIYVRREFAYSTVDVLAGSHSRWQHFTMPWYPILILLRTFLRDQNKLPIREPAGLSLLRS